MACTIITVRIWQLTAERQLTWPIPGWYMVELIALSIISTVDLFLDDARLAWMAVGAFLGFVVLGAFSVGFFYLPIATIFAVAAVLSDIEHRRNIPISLIIAMLAAVARGAIMLLIVQLLYP